VSVGIDRAFVRIAEGLVHLRKVEGGGETRPLVMIHASPGSSLGLQALMGALAAQSPGRALIAPDTLGAGDSAAPAEAAPDVAYYAGAVVRLLDAMGLERVDLYGGHTGARIVCELAVLHPERVGCVVMDGIAEYPADLREDLLANYAPPRAPDDYGSQFLWAFNFVRDMTLHFPYYARDPQHRLATRPVPSAQALHDQALEVLKGLAHYHKTYNAVFAYPARERIARLGRPALLLETATEIPSLNSAAEDLRPLLPAGRVAKVGGDVQEKASAMLAFLAEAAA
jgi:pimeloyl-ACP methyl ester carboxylesterase